MQYKLIIASISNNETQVIGHSVYSTFSPQIAKYAENNATQNTKKTPKRSQQQYQSFPVWWLCTGQIGPWDSGTGFIA